MGTTGTAQESVELTVVEKQKDERVLFFIFPLA